MKKTIFVLKQTSTLSIYAIQTLICDPHGPVLEGGVLRDKAGPSSQSLASLCVMDVITTSLSWGRCEYSLGLYLYEPVLKYSFTK